MDFISRILLCCAVTWLAAVSSISIAHAEEKKAETAVPANAATAPLSNIPAGDADLPVLRVPPYLLVEDGDGTILESNDPFLRWAPASLTKLMTAYTVFRTIGLQHIALNSPVRITEEAVAQPPSKMGFPIGTILTVDTALKILVVKSANDISVALAQGVGGTEENFVQLMNAHARRLGMADSRFQNPHGLHHPEQYTSARDMAVLVAALEKEFPQYRNFFDIVWLRIGSRRLRNHNALLRNYAGTNGMKTGYVCASGFNVIVRTKRNGRELTAIVFGGHSSLERNVRTAELLTSGFNKDPAATAGTSSETLQSMKRPEHTPVVAEDITHTLCPGKYAEAGQPEPRPADAPRAEAFDAIDTITFDLPVQADVPETPPIPQERPGTQPPPPTVASGETASQEGSVQVSGLAAAEYQRSLRERASAQFRARTDLRAEVVVSLGGATGPNPFGILHTNGGVYVPPPPVPAKRPEILEKPATEEYGLTQADDSEPVAQN